MTTNTSNNLSKTKATRSGWRKKTNTIGKYCAIIAISRQRKTKQKAETEPKPDLCYHSSPSNKVEWQFGVISKRHCCHNTCWNTFNLTVFDAPMPVFYKCQHSHSHSFWCSNYAYLYFSANCIRDPVYQCVWFCSLIAGQYCCFSSKPFL